MSAKLTLEPVGPDNWRDALDIEAHGRHEPRFVASTAYSIAQAYADVVARERGEPSYSRKPYLAVSDGEPVGFVLIGCDLDEPAARIFRMMVDRRHQGKGLGRALLLATLEHMRRDYPGRAVRLIYDPENTRAERLYASLGFQKAGLSDEGNVIAVLPASRSEARVA